MTRLGEDREHLLADSAVGGRPVDRDQDHRVGDLGGVDVTQQGDQAVGRADIADGVRVVGGGPGLCDGGACRCRVRCDGHLDLEGDDEVRLVVGAGPKQRARSLGPPQGLATHDDREGLGDDISRDRDLEAGTADGDGTARSVELDGHAGYPSSSSGRSVVGGGAERAERVEQAVDVVRGGARTEARADGPFGMTESLEQRVGAELAVPHPDAVLAAQVFGHGPRGEAVDGEAGDADAVLRIGEDLQGTYAVDAGEAGVEPFAEP